MDALTGWRLARRAGILFADMDAIAPYLDQCGALTPAPTLTLVPNPNQPQPEP